jgi:AcrR family transcriptional regulator
VGVTKRAVHHHLGSKTDLVNACVERAFRIFHCIRDGMSAYQGSRLEALSAAMRELSVAYRDDEMTPLSLALDFASLSPADRSRIRRYSGELASSYHALIGKGMDEGSIRHCDVQARVLILPGLINWLVKDDIPTDPVRREQIAWEVANMTAIGLCQLS